MVLLNSFIPIHHNKFKIFFAKTYKLLPLYSSFDLNFMIEVIQFNNI